MVNDILWSMDIGPTPFGAFIGAYCVRSVPELVEAIEKQTRKIKQSWCRSISYQNVLFYIWSTHFRNEIQYMKIALYGTHIRCCFVISINPYPDFWYSLRHAIQAMCEAMIVTAVHEN